ncbi:siderophore biosynthesis protein SbnG [Tumebacillus algifaecis]|uniref:Siderophore biosynthesis protein SbnG n=1 Tax=Tumebacillus algifaecis TaxID=1214604 RepID=A0A223CXK6_9BACL|nr:aldolase/citrate lyase family protein [Tumebacillus algifaecis]ASS74026.1 siderophore biosynthesis protein SbnG [Tumebacillus algifaecis]
MLRENVLKRKLQQGETVFGLICSVPHPTMVEMIAAADYDFVIIDTEHVLINPETLENMLRAADASGITALVRVQDAAPNTILRVLDAGAHGVVVPHVRTKEEAEAIVKASRYYPQGMRSLNGGRPADFAKIDLQGYLTYANEQVMVVPMIENREGVDNAADIASVPGVDMILEGAADLSQSYGLPWQTRSETVQSALAQAAAAVRAQGVPYCAIPRALEDVALWQERGVTAFVLGEERGTAFRALRTHLSTYRDAGTGRR